MKPLVYLFFSTLLCANTLVEDIKNRPKLSSKDIAQKQEGVYYTGLPLVNFDPDKGVGYGVRLFRFDNHDQSDPLFVYTPYRHQTYAQYFQTSNGWTYNELYWDAPYIFDSKFHFSMSLLYEKNTQAQYFGSTASSLGALKAPDGTTFESAVAYQEYLNTKGSPYYNRYLYEKPVLEANLQRDLLQGAMRLTLGLEIGKTAIISYENQNVPLNGTSTYNDKNLLFESQNGLVGYKGGKEVALKFGAIYDSRDFKPNAKRGSAHDMVLEFFMPALGSDFNYQRYTFSTKNFYTLPSYERLTLAAQAVYVTQHGQVPFFSLTAIGFSDGTKYGLGGLRTLRGYMQDRFVAPVKAFGNLEARWHATTLGTASQRFDIMLVPFVDAGTVANSPQEPLSNIKHSMGLGTRIVWNQATVIMIDYGKSAEDTGLYINFNNIF